ncbi:MAG: acyltransferase [Candidatus Accumulibacter sp.]|jgi:peptidoglycan/LPS O-acetylase OafA/YrhL|nr:acyltransferase [Accumulibacter sp.]
MNRGFPSSLDGAPEAGGPERIELLDCLRAFGALAVVFGHSLPRLAPGGPCGVSVFFALSGYLIARILMRKGMMTPRNIGIFLVRRIARIYPMYFLSVVGMTAYFFLFDARRFGIVAGGGGERTFFGILTFQYTASEWVGYGFGVLWTLIAECGFYVSFPFILWIGLATKKVFHVLGIVALISVCAKISVLLGVSVSSVSLLYYDHFILGALVAVSVGMDAVPHVLKTKWLGILGFALMILTVAIPYPGTRNLAWYLLSLLASSGTAMVILHHHLFGTTIHMPVAAFLGRISYSIYLVHAIVLDAFIGLRLIASIPLFLVVVVGISTLTARYIEQPVIRFVHKIARFKE